MHIPQDVVDLIVDQLSLLAGYEWIRRRRLQCASLVSTAWVNRSQHHLFSTLEFYRGSKLKEWCSRIKPDPCGVLRHVRVLTLGGKDMGTPPVLASDIETSLPHLTLLKNLRELIIGHPDIAHASLGVLTPIFSSSPGILKLRWWTRWDADIHEFWKDISTLAGLLPNLTHINLSDCPSESEVQLSVDKGSSLATKSSEFHTLRIIYEIPLSLSFFELSGPRLQILDLSVFRMYRPIECRIRAFQTLLEACHTLQVLNLCFFPGTAQFLGSIPSRSVSLIRISNPLRIGGAPMTYSDSWPWDSFEQFKLRRSCVGDDYLAELADLGVSIRKIAQKYSDHHPGLKTRVRPYLDLRRSEILAVENGEAPLYKTRLEEELGDHVDFELILVRYPSVRGRI